MDSAENVLNPNESNYISQCRWTALGNELVLTPLIGTLEIESDILTTSHKSLGGFRDDTQQTELWFFYNASGDNLIIRYYPTSSTPIQVLLRGSQLGFSLAHPITCCSIADKYLMFSDDYTYPKYVDMDKANRTNKKLSGSILFGKPDGAANYVFPYNTAGVNYYFKVYNGDGVVIADELVYTSNLAVMNDPVAGAIEYANAFNANSVLNVLFTAKYCGCGEVEATEVFESGKADGRITTFETYFVNNTSPLLPTTQISVYNNIYPNDFDEFHISRARRVPIKPADVTVGTDLDNTANLVQRINPQFAYRYIYTDSHYSTSNPISAIAIAPTDCSGRTGVGGNYREIDFTDESANPLAVDKGGILKISKYLQEIKAIEILVRDNNINQFQIAYRIERCEFGINRQWWRFYNDLQRTALATTEEPTVKLFDAVPLTYKAETMGTLASGEETRAYLSNTNEGYNPVCPDIRIEAQTTPNPSCSALYNVIIDMEIYCPFLTAWNNGLQAVWQYEGGAIVFGGMNSSAGGYVLNMPTDYFTNLLPAKGFVGYLAGTDYMAISKQIIGDSFEGDLADTEYGVIYGEGSSGRNAVRDAIGTGSVKQRFILYNVKAGRYAFRLASNMCTYGDTLGKGEMYDLDKGRNYQNTSIQMGSTSSQVNPLSEGDLVIELPFVTGVENVEYYATHECKILDLTDPSLGQGTCVSIFYTKDADGNNAPEVLKNGLSVEGMKFYAQSGLGIFKRFPEPTDNKYTDHNGFGYCAWNQLSAWNSESPSVQVDLYNGTPLKAYGENLYEGGLQSFYDGTLGDITQRMAKSIGSGLRATIATEYIIYTKDNTARNQSRNIVTAIADQNGNPLSNISVVIENVGRNGLTDSEGKFECLKYSNDVGGFGTVGQALIAMGDNCCIDPIVDEQEAELSFSVMPPLSADIPLPTTGYFQLTVNYDEVYATLKRGEQYTFAVVYYDNAKRSTTAEYTPNSSYYIPFWTQNTPNRDYYAFEWRIYSKPPSWATHFQILLARDRNYSRYVQTILGKVSYFQRYKDTANNTPSSFAAGNATEIHLSLAPINTFNEQNKNSSVGYTYQQGDRLRFIQQANGQLWDTFVDVEITGMEGDAVIIQNNSDLIEITEGCLVELYSFRKTDNGEAVIFYEIGEVMPIIEDGGIRYHGGGSDFTLGSGINIVAQDQSSANAYASGYINFGDTYLHNRSYQTNVEGLRQWSPLVESQNVSDFWESSSISIGRPNIWLPDKKNTDFPRVIRFSNPYSFSSGVNGLCSFEQLNRRDLDINLYEINYLTANLGYLIAISKLGTASVYLGATQMVNQQEGFISLSSAVLGGYNVLRPKDGRVMGTMHPQSVALVGGNPVCFNVQNGTVAMYTDGGIQILSDDGMRAEFLELANNLQPNDLVIAAYDSIYNEYTITIRDRRGQGYKSYVYSFNDQTRGWSQSLRYFPAGISGTSYGLTSYSNGALWKHNAGAINTFYGNFLPAIIGVVFNDSPNTLKTFRSLEISGTYTNIALGNWAAKNAGDIWGQHPRLTRLMQTYAKQRSWQKLFSSCWCPVKLDLNTPDVVNPIINGEPMQVNVLYCTFINENTDNFATLQFNSYHTTATELQQ